MFWSIVLCFEEIVSLYWNFAKGITAKAQGTAAVGLHAQVFVTQNIKGTRCPGRVGL